MNQEGRTTSGNNSEKFRFIIPVDSIPGLKSKSSSLYHDIVDEFLNSSIKYAELSLDENDFKKNRGGLYYYIRKNKIKEVEVRYSGKKIYLARKNKL